MRQVLKCKGTLSSKLIRGGQVIATQESSRDFNATVNQTWWQRLKALIFGEAGLVTTAGVTYMATDFAAGLASPRISAFNYHDCGTGTTAAAVGDTALGSAAGTARVAGTQSNPASGQYKTVATISFTSSLAITEWGLFSASASGTLWDRRVFSAINVASGDSIQFSYTLTVNAGGS